MATQPKTAHNEVTEEDGVVDENINKLNDIQKDIDRLNEEASGKILEVEQKYNKLRKPLFDIRSKYIQNIPKFWSTALLKHKALRETFTENDTEALSYLKNLEVQEFEDIKSGYKITLTFDRNPFFTNSVLEKEFHIEENGQTFVRASKIDWLPGKCLATPKEQSAGKKRGYDVEESFFNWFSDDDMMHTDDIGDVIKDELWVSPMPYFMSSENGDDEEEDGSDEEYDDDDVEDEENGDDGEEEELLGQEDDLKE